jgi:para-aminobenzoate synthetase component I
LTNTSVTTGTYPISNFKEIKEKVLNWVQRVDTFSFLDNHQYPIEPHTMECLLAAGVKRKIKADAGNALEQLSKFIYQSDPRFGGAGCPGQKGSWLFGHLSYDLKNEIETLTSSNQSDIQFPDLFFFEPEIIIRITDSEMIIESDDPAIVFADIMKTSFDTALVAKSATSSIQNKITKEEYITIIKNLQQHILRGDCYEINFCQEFYDSHAVIDPVGVYKKLNRISPNPFSALYKMDDQWLICASPERYLKKQGNKILSQPIKGTSKRASDKQEDEQSKNDLLHSAKDRSENVMVVDLVRNDLAKICKEGTVQVDELYGIYSFPQVHQMISTISGELKENISFCDIIKATFPMGSMTGAPKKRVMELIEKYEHSKRGIFSGAAGYIAPGGDFDFNVVIRSIMYNAAAGYLSFQAGSAITFYSDPEKEWEECLLKAEAIKKVLEEK